MLWDVLGPTSTWPVSYQTMKWCAMHWNRWIRCGTCPYTWEGYPDPSDDTWEPAFRLRQDVPDLVAKFESETLI